MTDPTAIRAHVAQLPLGAFLFVLGAWSLGSFLGAWLAARLAPRKQLAHGLIVGAPFLAASVANLVMLPHP
ncbi:MAG: hypothetical protein ACRD15_07315, partial [Vicinamibacterales bacterium]